MAGGSTGGCSRQKAGAARKFGGWAGPMALPAGGERAERKALWSCVALRQQGGTGGCGHLRSGRAGGVVVSGDAGRGSDAEGPESVKGAGREIFCESL
jgi:hypothetical protein